MQDNENSSSSSSSTCELNKPLDSNTTFYNLNELMGVRENEMIRQMDMLSDFYRPYKNDEKIKEIFKKQVRKTRERYIDVIKYNLGLDLFDNDYTMNDEISPILFKRKFLEKKRITDKKGDPLHIYKNKDGKYIFVDDEFINNIGIGLREMQFFAEHSKDFVFDPNFANSPIAIDISDKRVAIPRAIENYVEDDVEAFWNNLNAIYSYVGNFLASNKKLKSVIAPTY